jgi:hypothetical protein
MILFHDFSIVKVESDKTSYVFPEEYGFPIKGKLIRCVLKSFCDAAVAKSTVMLQPPDITGLIFFCVLYTNYMLKE